MIVLLTPSHKDTHDMNKKVVCQFILDNFKITFPDSSTSFTNTPVLKGEAMLYLNEYSLELLGSVLQTDSVTHPGPKQGLVLLADPGQA